MEIAGYLASFIVGVSLGLVGGGGSILMVPVLVYLFRISPVDATAYSLFIVGFTSLIGAFPKLKQNLVSFRTAIVFGIPSIIAVFLTRQFIVPALPEIIWSGKKLVVTSSLGLMVLFGVIMIAASFSMLRNQDNQESDEEEKQRFNFPLILFEGTLVGLLTGLIGAGGGFLIIPALVTLSKLPMKKAVGTSLLIIAAKSLIGVLGDLNAGAVQIDFRMLSTIVALSVAGILVGNGISKKVDGEKLKRWFGWMVLVMGAYVIFAELTSLYD